MELFNDALSAIFRDIDAAGKSHEVREQLESFATGAGIYHTLFRKAGPAADGTFATSRVLENLAVLVGPKQAEATLAQWLYEYVSFAIFVAEPYVRSSGPGATTLAKRVAEL